MRPEDRAAPTAAATRRAPAAVRRPAAASSGRLAAADRGIRWTVLGLTLALAATVAPSSGASAQTSDERAAKNRADQGIASLRASLQDTSVDLTRAFLALRQTQDRLPGARQQLVVAQDLLAQAEQRDSQLAVQLSVAQASEAKAAAALVRNAADIAKAEDAVGQLASQTYSQGEATSALSVALGATDLQDLAQRMALADTVASVQNDALRALATVRAEGIAQQDHLTALREQVAQLASQSAIAVQEAQGARDAAAAAKAQLDALVADQQRLAGTVAARKAGEQARLAAMQAESDRLGAILAARARAAAAARARAQAAARARAQATARRSARGSTSAPSAGGSGSGGSGGASQQGSGFLSYPVNAGVTSEFGLRFHPILHYFRLHAGIDFGAACGTPVHAAADGSVVLAGGAGGAGNQIVLDHGLQRGVDLATAYDHLSRIVVSAGHVSRGQLIAYSGTTGLSTGCHLHFETRENGTPVNPRRWL